MQPPPEPVSPPVKLTFPAREPGARKIMAGKLQVGHCLADHRMRWTAYFWVVPGRPGEGIAGAVTGTDLARMREAAVRWAARHRQWWSDGSGVR
jgi:hypothetical protein